MPPNRMMKAVIIKKNFFLFFISDYLGLGYV
jgi:hypothetical protein